MHRAYYHAAVRDFLNESISGIIGELTRHSPHDVIGTQTRAWECQIQQLQGALADCAEGHVFFEFQIPRIGRRADVVLVLSGVVFVLEYKLGASRYDRAALDQAMDYALDLKNFHAGSRNTPIVPILVATAAPPTELNLVEHKDRVFDPVAANLDSLPVVLTHVLSHIEAEPLDELEWMAAPYQPTPTIIEAAQSLYENHSVEEISRSDAAAENLTTTAAQVAEVIARSEQNRRKSICFITGVPGAGKTLAGLNIATARQNAASETGAVFLSGNDPLVRVLREALARNLNATKDTPISDARRATAKFIQNIRHFRDETHQSGRAPHEHVVVFDEAQRAWRQEQLSNFMKRKRNDPDFCQSEPEFLLSVMDRHDWCCVVCLVGGGQEINTGEAGIGEWLKALQHKFAHWNVYYSDRLTGREYDWDGDLAGTLNALKAEARPGLHLSVALRSFRAENLSNFMSAVVAGDTANATRLMKLIPDYPVVITRVFETACQWVRAKARGSERYGVLASAGGARLRPEGIVVKLKAEPEQWFLNGPDDVRSSYYLEDVATEFDVQGLELDWTIVCWDANYRRSQGQWTTHNFIGTKWQTVRDTDRQRYVANSYRVLLTRARQGVVIFVPKGDAEDPTRNPVWYDSIYNYLRECGIPHIEQ